MGNYLYSCCPPSAYPVVRYRAVAVRPKEESEEEALQSGWQAAKSSSDDELLCIGSASDDEFVVYKLKKKPTKNVFTNGASANIDDNHFLDIKRPQPLVPLHIRQKIAKASRRQTETTQPHGITDFERICFDIRQSSESVDNLPVAAHQRGHDEGSSEESYSGGYNRGHAYANPLEGSSSETLAFDQLVLQINSPWTTPFKSLSGDLTHEQRASQAVSAAQHRQLSQSVGGAHPHGSHEHHFANLIVNPMAEAEPATSMYGGAVRERVSLSPDVLTAESPPTASIELEWEKEPGMGHYKPEKPLPSASQTVDSSLGGLSSSRLRSLCSTPASLEWDFKESTTSLMEVALGADEEEEEAWGASDTEELLHEIELLAARALHDDPDREGTQRPLHDR